MVADGKIALLAFLIAFYTDLRSQQSSKNWVRIIQRATEDVEQADCAPHEGFQACLELCSGGFL